MPKRRLPGHLNRRSRRRDGAPNVPPAPVPGSTREVVPEPATAPAPSEETRYVRPTQRRAIPSGTRPTTSVIPIDYAHVRSDLTQVLVLSGVGLAIIVGLAFVIR